MKIRAARRPIPLEVIPVAQTVSPARQVALLALSACERQGAWSDGYLKKTIREAGLDSRDAALCSRLCFGVLQNRMLLDFWLAGQCRMPLNRLEDKVLQSLRLGLYQLRFLDRVPPSAAVDQSVALARKYAKNPRAAGLVNGVLRGILRAGDSLPQPEDLATRYSHPDWLVKEFSLALSADDVEPLLAADNAQPPTAAQVNTCRADTAQVQASLRAQGVEAMPHPWLEDCLLLEGTGDLERLEAFEKGWIYIQDPAARLAVLAAAPQPGMKVLDACAAPGGKSFAAAIAMGGEGDVLARDIHPHKERLIQTGARRLGLSCVHTAVADARTVDPALEGTFDLVLADVPCSGLGIIRKKPDIRYKDPAPLKNLPAVQGAILDSLSRCVRPGGTLLYATCTLLERENGGVVRHFLAGHPDFSLTGFTLPGPAGEVPGGMCTLWPHIHGTDGFFFARLRRAHT